MALILELPAKTTEGADVEATRKGKEEKTEIGPDVADEK